MSAEIRLSVPSSSITCKIMSPQDVNMIRENSPNPSIDMGEATSPPISVLFGGED